MIFIAYIFYQVTKLELRKSFWIIIANVIPEWRTIQKTESVREVNTNCLQNTHAPSFKPIVRCLLWIHGQN